MNSSQPRLRQAARGLVLDDDDAVLLVCFPTENGNYWATPGGGLEAGETMREGLRRELAEELGQSDLEIGPLLWTRTSSFAVSDSYDGQYNEIYLVRCKRFDPEPEIGWDGMRAEGVSDIRWWTLDEIEAAPHSEIFVPTDLAARTRELVKHGPPPEARSLNATSFGLATSEYTRGRPGYPTEAVAWMLEPLTAGSTIADIGAGTGKLTERLVELGYSPVAIDPHPDMLASLSSQLPAVPTYEGSAESLPLADHSCDAATFGQAWHWVDVERAGAELSRVVRPGGVVALIWNIRDVRTDWTAELADIMRESLAERMIRLDEVNVPTMFSTPDRVEIEWSRTVTRSQLESLVRSRSPYITGSPRIQGVMDREMGELFDRLALTGTATIELPYVTHAYRMYRP